MRKLTALIAGGAGYILGAKAGRQRYEQLRGQFQKVKANPKVQQTATKATDAAKTAAPVIKDKVSGVTDKTKSSSSSTSTGTSTYSSGTTTAAGAAGVGGVGGGLAADEVIANDLADDTTVGPLTEPDVLIADGDPTTNP